MRRGREWSTWRLQGPRLRGGSTRGLGPATLALAAGVVLIGIALLRAIWVVFQHAYLNSYLWVPGTRVTSAYWGAIGFALRSTVMVVALIAGVVALIATLAAHRR
jgi:hypothetical protein